MTRSIFLSLALIFSLLSCSNDDDNSPIGIEGEWNLTNIQGGFLGVDQDFDRGVVVWNFNPATEMVTVSNNYIGTDVSVGPASGTYPYIISAPADAEELIINEISLGVITISGTSFSLNELAIDGFKYTFNR